MNFEDYILKCKEDIVFFAEHMVRSEDGSFYTLEDCDYIMTEFENKFYIFPVFGTAETKLWLTDVRLKTQRKAEDYLAEKTLQEL